MDFFFKMFANRPLYEMKDWYDIGDKHNSNNHISTSTTLISIVFTPCPEINVVIVIFPVLLLKIVEFLYIIIYILSSDSVTVPWSELFQIVSFFVVVRNTAVYANKTLPLKSKGQCTTSPSLKQNRGLRGGEAVHWGYCKGALQKFTSPPQRHN